MNRAQSEPRIFLESVTISFLSFDDDFSQYINDTTDFETIIIDNLPTVQEAINLISWDYFLQKFYQTSYSKAIKFNICNTISTLSPLQFEILSTKIDKSRSLLLSIESINDGKCCFYWKSCEENPLAVLSLIDITLEDRKLMNNFIFQFLLMSLRLGNDGE